MSPSIQFIVNLRANMKLAAVCLLIAASVALATAQGTMHCRVPICDNHDGTLTFWPDPRTKNLLGVHSEFLRRLGSLPTTLLLRILLRLHVTSLYSPGKLVANLHRSLQSVPVYRWSATAAESLKIWGKNVEKCRSDWH